MTFMVCLLSDDRIKIRILDTWQLRIIIFLFFRNESEKVDLLIKTLIKVLNVILYLFLYLFGLCEFEFI